MICASTRLSPFWLRYTAQSARALGTVSSKHQMRMPLLLGERRDGSGRSVEEEIPEEQLYCYTRNRWIFNEAKQLSSRYLKFDLEQLIKAAVKVAPARGTRYCTQVLKCQEGLYNKAFILRMDDGTEVIAKLPCPAAGPKHYTTASEVATRKFLLDFLKIPTPRILAWSANQGNPVGAEYIIEERAAGERLGGLWYQWPLDSKLGIISEIVQIEQRLASTAFNTSGCIYFEADMPTGDKILTTPLLPTLETDRYRLGPLVMEKLWGGRCGKFDADRGPYSTPLAFVEAMAKNEISYVERHAEPRMNFYKSSTQPQRPSEAVSLLKRYLKIAKAMIPVQEPDKSKDITLSTLWHPDLHLDNIFVDPKSKQITSIIDWQWSAVLPLYYQCGIPRAFENPGPTLDGAQLSELPRDYAALPTDEKTRIDVMRQSEACQKYYELETSLKNPRHWSALQVDNLDLRRRPTRLASGLWDSEKLFFFREALMDIKEQWTELSPDSGQCPISFSEEERAQHAYEEENQQGIRGILKLFKDRWSLSTDGMVDPVDFAQTKAAIDDYRKVFLESAEDEDEKVLFSKLWPYQDTGCERAASCETLSL